MNDQTVINVLQVITMALNVFTICMLLDALRIARKWKKGE